MRNTNKEPMLDRPSYISISFRIPYSPPGILSDSFVTWINLSFINEPYNGDNIK